MASELVFDKGSELLGRLRAVAFIKPGLELSDRRHFTRCRREGDPSALAEPVTCRRSKPELPRFCAGVGQFEGDAEGLALNTEIGKCLAVHREIGMAGPRTLGLDTWIGETEGAKLLQYCGRLG